MSERPNNITLQVEAQGAYIHVEDALGKASAHRKATSADVCDGFLVLKTCGKPIEVYGAGRWNRVWIAPSPADASGQPSEGTK